MIYFKVKFDNSILIFLGVAQLISHHQKNVEKSIWLIFMFSSKIYVILL
jgi:hypothetical protein